MEGVELETDAFDLLELGTVAPFPWFGGKRTVADIVWKRFGRVRNYVEPFAGSAAMLLQRPTPWEGTETINDADGYVANFWRAVKSDPDSVAEHADWPVNENDLHARHAWLLGERDTLGPRLEGTPDWFDAKIAGWWCWGQCCWIGSGFCSGNGPWQVAEVDGIRKLVHLGNAGQGVNRKLVHLGNAGQGVNRKLVHLGDAGQGVNRKLVHLGDAGRGVNRQRVENGVYEWMNKLAKRLERVRVCCGDWQRVCGPTPTVKQGLTAVFLDPPYADTDDRQMDLYNVDCGEVANAVAEWAKANGGDKRIRIAACGYDSIKFPDDWECVNWKAKGGYGSQGDGRGKANASREAIWFSPHCLKPEQTPDLFTEHT